MPGELLTGLGIAGWPEVEAIRTAALRFNEWLASRGGDTPAEERAGSQHRAA